MTGQRETTARQEELTQAIIKAAMFEMVMMPVGAYFLLAFVDPATITGLGLPVVFEGPLNIVLAIAAFTIGATPLLRTLVSANSRK